MRLNLFLLLVTLTSIACDSIVATSKGLIQVKTLDANSQRERAYGIRRNLRGEVTGADIADGEERAFFNFQSLMAKGSISNFQNAALKMSKERYAAILEIVGRKYASLVNKFKKLHLKKQPSEEVAVLKKEKKTLTRTKRFKRSDDPVDVNTLTST
ncbi:hypothetical protein KXD40_007568 [Peronospora effusa]|uniref:RxLR effector protein n=1 Tax=Peronospora effusa TaxID=542832 RepID=A0A3M6V960_9STRA|nr:hypothetical protein DD238_008519 [Peronospora effusa]RQM11207.1 hypothetical protein DD237_008576 [Peronospora effusa]UIZ28764.1 hypothetical protein KXD40_007568 [Peronospora effusa]